MLRSRIWSWADLTGGARNNFVPETLMKGSTDNDPSVLSWPECARLCKSPSKLPNTAIAFVWGQNDHVLRRFFQTTALPRLRQLHIEMPTWQRGPGELFLGLAARGRPLEEMTVTTSLDLARTRLVTFTIRFDDEGKPFSRYSFPREPLREGELEDAAIGLGIPRPIIPG
jgi:hypothetical protein